MEEVEEETADYWEFELASVKVYEVLALEVF